MRNKVIIFSILLLTAFSLNNKAQPGANDSTFNPSDIGFGFGDDANGLVYTTSIQNDGKIFIGGNFSSYNGTTIRNIARLNTDGTLDFNFNPGISANNIVRTMAIQNDGKIIIGGGFTSYNGTIRNRIARLNANGTLDITFNPGTGANSTIYTTSIQSDGKIIIGGNFTSYNGTTINRIARLNTDGTLDGTFNPGNGANSIIYATAIQSDGKIIIGGIFTSYNLTAINRIARLNVDGTLDGTFNPGTGANSTINTISVQSDGKIFIGGDFTSYNGTIKNRIARLNSDGTLDATFNIGSGANNTIYTTTMLSNGKIIICGDFTYYNFTVCYRVAQLNADGTIDGTFNPNPATGANNPVYSTSLQSDGKIIIGGWFTSYNGIVQNYIARLNSNGTFDGTFNPGTGTNNTVLTTSIQSNGKIIIGGIFTSYYGSINNRIARLNTDGTLDSTFNSGTGANSYVQTIAIQNNGKIIIGGDFGSYNGTAIYYIARLNANGTLDGTFNSTGPGANATVYSTSVQSDGKIIIAGNFTNFNGITSNRIARLNTAGTLDGSFNNGTGANYCVYTTLIQSDGKIIIGGFFTSYNGTPINCIARINTDGTLDSTFNPGTGVIGTVRTTAIQSDGKIIIGGIFSSYNGTAINNIARLNADGTLDSTFNVGTGTNNIVYTTSILSIGKIIIGGDFTSYNGIAINHIVCLNTDGTIDGTFNVGTGTDNTIRTTALQSDGKIIIGGTFISYNGIGRNRIARILNSCNSTLSSLNQTACDTYTSPSGKVWITSRIENDTISNTFGCDSIITITLTINNSTNSTTIITACDSYQWTNGNTYSSSGTYSQTLVNSSGCDSIANLNLSIQNSTSSSTIVTACNSYLWTDGNTYTSSGTYAQTLVNAGGCDSTVTINLTIGLPQDSTIDITECDTFTAPDGQVYYQSGIYTAIIPTVAGCDSTITINLEVRQSTDSAFAVTACDSYTAPDGQEYSGSGIITAVIPNISGCDSTITIDLTILSPTSSEISEEECFGYTAPDGQQYTATGQYIAVIPNAAGCDSTITINLTINTVDVSVTNNDPVLEANASGAEYAWVDCNNGFAVVDSGSQIFTATENGSYAVIVTQNGCTDTSNCYQITSVGMINLVMQNGISIYPNPSSFWFYIDIGGFNYADILVKDVTGKNIIVFSAKSGITRFGSGLLPGIYYVTVKAGESLSNFSLIRY